MSESLVLLRRHPRVAAASTTVALAVLGSAHYAYGVAGAFRLTFSLGVFAARWRLSRCEDDKRTRRAKDLLRVVLFAHACLTLFDGLAISRDPKVVLAHAVALLSLSLGAWIFAPKSSRFRRSSTGTSFTTAASLKHRVSSITADDLDDSSKWPETRKLSVVSMDSPATPREDPSSLVEEDASTVVVSEEGIHTTSRRVSVAKDTDPFTGKTVTTTTTTTHTVTAPTFASSEPPAKRPSTIIPASPPIVISRPSLLAEHRRESNLTFVPVGKAEKVHSDAGELGEDISPEREAELKRLFRVPSAEPALAAAAHSPSPLIQNAVAKRFSSTSAPPCVVCGESAYAMESMQAMGGTVHKRCFRCAHCKSVLTLSSFASVNKMVYCKTHYFELFAKNGGKYEGAFGDSGFAKKSLGSYTPTRESFVAAAESPTRSPSGAPKPLTQVLEDPVPIQLEEKSRSVGSRGSVVTDARRSFSGAAPPSPASLPEARGSVAGATTPPRRASVAPPPEAAAPPAPAVLPIAVVAGAETAKPAETTPARPSRPSVSEMIAARSPRPSVAEPPAVRASRGSFAASPVVLERKISTTAIPPNAVRTAAVEATKRASELSKHRADLERMLAAGADRPAGIRVSVAASAADEAEPLSAGALDNAVVMERASIASDRRRRPSEARSFRSMSGASVRSATLG